MTALRSLPRTMVLTTLAATLLAGSPAVAQEASLAPAPTVDDAQGGSTGDRSLEARLPLEGTTWRLVESRWGDQLRAVGPEVAAWMTLRAGRLRGSGGCDRIAGRYARMGDAVVIDVDSVDGPPCPQPAMRVQRALIEGLASATEVELPTPQQPLESELILRDAAGTETLRFRVDDAAALDLGEWRLAAYSAGDDTIAADPGQPAVLAFQASRDRKARRRSEGEVVGSSGCNGFVGEYARHADVLRVRRLERTDAPCPAQLRAQEDAIVGVLESSTLRLELPPDRLVLTSDDAGERLELVASAPLEGSTWLLARVPGSPPPEADVTLRLDDGAVLGEGPCGAYSGRYETNGIFIAFSDLVGSADRGCPERAREADLLAALRRAVLIDRTAPRLRFLDARGRTVARFQRPTGP